MPRKLLAVFMSLLMLMMSMAVYATETEHVHEGCCGEKITLIFSLPENNAVMPMANLCSNCETGTLVKRTYTNYHHTELLACCHGGGGSDHWACIEDGYYYTCSNCDYVGTRYATDKELTLIYCPNGA